MSATDIEKKNLEAHVELCAERYAALEEKLNQVERRMTVIETHVIEIKESISSKTGGINKQIISIGTAIIAAMFAAIITLLVHLAGK